MIDEKELERVCRLAGLMKITTAKAPTYRNKEGTAGIELTKEGLRGFWFAGFGEHDYDKIMDDLKICSVLQAFEAETSKYEPILDPKTQEKVGERLKAANMGIVEDKPVEVGIIKNIPAVLDGKRIIIPQDIEELKKMSTFDRILLFQKTHPAFIKERQGRGGKYKYVEGNVMKMEANIAFLFKVSSKIEGWHIDEKGVACYGSMIVNIDNEVVSVGGVGIDVQEFHQGDKTKPVFSVAELMKNAWTDCRKKMLADMGFNGDVYRGEV